MNQVATPKFGIGAPVRRKEDNAFITGQGHYTDDISVEGAVHAVVLRSSLAHAKITLSGVDDARSMEGVHLILTAADLEGINKIPCKAVLKQLDGTRHWVPHREVLCSDTVRFVGDAIAFVVADSIDQARAALEVIEVDYDDLDVAIGCEAALDENAACVWPEHGTNKAFHIGMGNKDAMEEGFAQAHHITKIKVVNNRLVSNAVEPRACIGEFDNESGRYTLTTGTQGGHGMRDLITKNILGIDPKDLRVVTPDVGGGFGTKMFTYLEYPLCLVAAKRLGRPVKWLQERTEHFMSDAQGRDNVSEAELALDADGKMIGLKVHVIADMGAYLHEFGPGIPSIGITMTSGLYDIPGTWVEATGVYTNTVPVDAFRGAGRPEAAYVLERLVDKAAFETGVDPAEFRRKSFISSEALPYTTALGRMYDTGEFDVHLTKALETVGYAGFAEREAESKANGLYRGIGMATYVEACAFAGGEEATLELNKNGSVTLLIGTQSNGQGHATAYGQVVAEQLGLQLDQVEMVQGDTDRVRTGGGTGGSRSIPLGLTSVKAASETLVRKIKEIASEKLEVGVADLELEDGHVRVVGTDQQISLVDIAGSLPEQLSAAEKVMQDECTYPNGTHICELEIDPETGKTEILKYVIVDDFGVTVNPMLLAGQVHGGAGQAISQALYENTVYDETGQLLSASYMDYHIARADNLPSFDFSTNNVPSTTNALGIKGAGEAGSIGAAPAVMNAVMYALRKNAGLDEVDMPATPVKVWSALQQAQG
ncbi:xanthine dehydrogenase family protein molybdopterin-binding subunit [Pseudovibrio sp. Tun.PSC04-5.I4]|uniref:xanthine dehydrogenase family protein molybdopterin-binding subunit n=1 Tax=Pseudovibrio sp. Tun.PSC04-5.I4 TaxID=1798213 RepID=UPI00088A6C12|nr:xanthine dehydrogenase family protein molybdopterin-binding subunit [Pseudovibrio sp. Tun.PSC04-5.I4]SDR36652.1 xanthine dehydrogenase, molybdenum binding subunit apoprotein [Pseudovibrio sp. Tun.PSC04-5.I4]